MLPAALRVHTRRDHLTVARSGRRARRGGLLIMVASTADAGAPARAAVVAGRKVGGAVARNSVKRRVRSALAETLPGLPAGTLLVVRALPGSAGARQADLTRWLQAGLSATLPRARPPSPSRRAVAASHG